MNYFLSTVLSLKELSLWENKKEVVLPFSSSLTFTLGESILLRHHIRAYENSSQSNSRMALVRLTLTQQVLNSESDKNFIVFTSAALESCEPKERCWHGVYSKTAWGYFSFARLSALLRCMLLNIGFF